MVSLTMHVPEPLPFSGLEAGRYGDCLQSLMTLYRREKERHVHLFMDFVDFGALCAAEAPPGQPPTLLHVGHQSLLAQHFGRAWLSEPSRWDNVPDKNLDTVAAHGYEAPLLGEPSLYEISVFHKQSRFGAYARTYRRLAFPVQTRTNFKMILQVSISVTDTLGPRPRLIVPGRPGAGYLYH